MLMTSCEGRKSSFMSSPSTPSPLPPGQPQGLIPGVVAAVLAALAGAVSSFVAYQKRRLCFREGGERGRRGWGAFVRGPGGWVTELGEVTRSQGRGRGPGS